MKMTKAERYMAAALECKPLDLSVFDRVDDALFDEAVESAHETYMRVYDSTLLREVFFKAMAKIRKESEVDEDIKVKMHFSGIDSSIFIHPMEDEASMEKIQKRFEELTGFELLALYEEDTDGHLSL